MLAHTCLLLMKKYSHFRKSKQRLLNQPYIFHCLSYFSRCWDKIPNTLKVRGGEVCFGSVCTFHSWLIPRQCSMAEENQFMARQPRSSEGLRKEGSLPFQTAPTVTHCSHQDSPPNITPSYNPIRGLIQWKISHTHDSVTSQKVHQECIRFWRISRYKPQHSPSQNPRYVTSSTVQ